ncbi:calcium/calmodulin dependent protein kinase II association-domain protein [Bradyrhizobium oligotrophicum S58]|uniref:Calcium/calmodulin dependent protein kinase II association-domain protein n=1 Tax=Bradyrhizobium oligotrophicum S58 TaxID=1245469 RepID=M4Z6F5_9BRAD|nr:calcium/calmodulin dependent protein kinase II association-domain protein [Bradyrhizobium oligotrophicum]BAM88969.1 calcium/calmodulin dependent protein kinase II association-domain protein [Bradyrhizobium oligotrophicum S58]
MKRHWMSLLGCAAVAILLALPSEGAARTARRHCVVTPERVKALLKNWQTALNESTATKPGPVVATYAERAVLLPTCANGPLTTREQITSYFFVFLKDRPKADIDPDKALIGGDCNFAFASGLYTFTTQDNAVLRARYTYVFHGNKIVQHHSSLEPQGRGNVPRALCKEKPE